MTSTTTRYGSVLLTFKAHKERDLYVSDCVELGTSSFGQTFEEAIANAEEATTVYLESLIEEGQLDAVFKRRGVRLLPPGQDNDEEIPVKAHPGEIVSPRVLKLPILAA